MLRVDPEHVEGLTFLGGSSKVFSVIGIIATGG